MTDTLAADSNAKGETPRLAVVSASMVRRLRQATNWQTEIDGVPMVPRSWEDTVNVTSNGRVTIAFRPDDRPGNWMYHCHILEHHAAGMMGHFEVVR